MKAMFLKLQERTSGKITIEELRDVIGELGAAAVCVRDDNGISHGYWTLAPEGDTWRIHHHRQGMSGIEDSVGLSDTELAERIGDREVEISLFLGGETRSFQLRLSE